MLSKLDMLVAFEGIWKWFQVNKCLVGKLLVNKTNRMHFLGVLPLVATVTPFVLSPSYLPHIEWKRLLGFFIGLLLHTPFVQSCLLNPLQRFSTESVHHTFHLLGRGFWQFRFLCPYLLTLTFSFIKLPLYPSRSLFFYFFYKKIVDRSTVLQRRITIFFRNRQRSCVVPLESGHFRSFLWRN